MIPSRRLPRSTIDLDTEPNRGRGGPQPMSSRTIEPNGDASPRLRGIPVMTAGSNLRLTKRLPDARLVLSADHRGPVA